MNWIPVNKGDVRARGLADRHYNRQTKYAPQFTRPGNNLVFLTQDCRAVWVSWKPAQDIKRMDEYTGAYECTIFRNESDILSSELIKEAVELTEEIWGAPENGWITYVMQDKIKSVNPGYCYLKAGWRHDGKSKTKGLVRLRLCD